MSSRLTMLIVDDSQVSRMMIKAIVHEAMPDWDVIEAGNAQEAVEQLEQSVGGVDYISMDMNMPGIDGLTIIPTIKEKCPDAKIALLTANIQDSVRAKAEQLGVQFITKPITEDKIIPFISGIDPTH
ncbi:MAG: response regulator [Gammaproteobacteria bacterium]|nr:MAG: response regulator [Gammaproteobacteria bacterium]